MHSPRGERRWKKSERTAKRNPVREQERPADMDGKGTDWTGVLVQKKGTHTPAKGDRRSTARKKKKLS